MASSHYSPSSLETFETCPHKFKLIYRDRLKAEFENIEAFLGSCFHKTMEELYSKLPDRVMPLEELLAFYEDYWKRNLSERVKVNENGLTPDDYFRRGKKYIEDYYRHYYPFNQNRILGLEQKIEVDLDGTGRYRLLGYVDRIDLTPDGVFEIHDYKTGSYLPGQEFVDSDRQLAIYQLGIKQRWPQAEKFRLVWHYVAFDLELSSTRTEEQLAELRKRLIEQIKLIEAETEFPPKESQLCRWCAFWEFCPAKKHEAILAKIPPEEYLNEDGLVLVNRYVDFLKKKKEAESELEKLKKAIIDYAQKKGLSKVQGSEGYVRIIKQERLQIPASGEPERLDLEKILKEAGLWESCSTLDRFALEKIISGGQLEPPLLNKISTFIKKEVQYSLRANWEDSKD
jgi:putative RecB family exonuclease